MLIFVYAQLLSSPERYFLAACAMHSFRILSLCLSRQQPLPLTYCMPINCLNYALATARTVQLYPRWCILFIRYISSRNIEEFVTVHADLSMTWHYRLYLGRTNRPPVHARSHLATRTTMCHRPIPSPRVCIECVFQTTPFNAKYAAGMWVTSSFRNHAFSLTLFIATDSPFLYFSLYFLKYFGSINRIFIIKHRVEKKPTKNE